MGDPKTVPPLSLETAYTLSAQLIRAGGNIQEVCLNEASKECQEARASVERKACEIGDILGEWLKLIGGIKKEENQKCRFPIKNNKTGEVLCFDTVPSEKMELLGKVGNLITAAGSEMGLVKIECDGVKKTVWRTPR